MKNEPELSKKAAAEWAKQLGLEITDSDLSELLPLIHFQIEQGRLLRNIPIDSNVEPDSVFLADGD